MLKAWLCAAICAFVIPTQGRAVETLTLSRPLTLIWTFTADEVGGLPPATYEGELYLPSGPNEITSLYAATGELRWKSDVGGVLTVPAAADRQGVYIFTAVTNTDSGGREIRTGLVRLLGSESGVTLWTRRVPSPVTASVSYSTETLIVAAEDGSVRGLNKKTGEDVWSARPSGHALTGLASDANRLFASDWKGQIFSIDARSGKALWRYRTRESRAALLSVGRAKILAASDRRIYALDAGSGRVVWQTQTGATVQTLASDEKRVYISAADNFVYCLSAETGKRVWKRRMPGRVTARLLVTESGIFVAPLSADEALVLNPENGRTINSIKVGPGHGIAAPPMLAGGVLLITKPGEVLAYSNAKFAGL